MCDGLNFAADNALIFSIEYLAQQRAFYDRLRGLTRDELQNRGYEISSKPPPQHVYMEFTYIVDLDELLFIVDNNVFYPLNKIPRGKNDNRWIQFLTVDGCNVRCAHPSTPRKFFADIYPPMDDLLYHNNVNSDGQRSRLRPRLIRDTEWKPSRGTRSALNVVSLYMMKAMLEDQYSKFSTIHMYRPDTKAFQVPAKALLAQAAPGLYYSTSSPVYMDGCTTRSLLCIYTEVMSRRDYDFFWKDSDLEEYILQKGVNLFYWFRNCLIVMASRLDDEVYLKSWMSIAEERLKAKLVGDETLTAVLWSIRHAMVLQVSKGTVSRTRVVPVVESYWDNKRAFEDAVDMLMYYLQPSFTPPHENGSQRQVRAHRENTTISTRPDPRRPSLPFDVVLRILDNADPWTQYVCSSLTKTVRCEWAKHPWISGLKLYASSTHSEHPDACRAIKSGLSEGEPVSMNFVHCPVDYNSGLEEQGFVVSVQENGCPIFAYVKESNWDIPDLIRLPPHRQIVRASFFPPHWLGEYSRSNPLRRCRDFLIPTKDIEKVESLEPFPMFFETRGGFCAGSDNRPICFPWDHKKAEDANL